MALTGSIHSEVTFPSELYKLIKTRKAIGLTRADIEVVQGCELGSYKDIDLPKDFEIWQTLIRVEVIKGVPTIFKQWSASWKL